MSDSNSHHLVQIYDTTLRDGTQGESISLTVMDKLRIAQRLDDFGAAFVEGGWPGSNPKDAEFFQRARELPWKNSVLAAFGSTCRVGGSAADDRNLLALLESGAPVCTIFGKSSAVHATEILRTTKEENLRIIRDSVAFLVGQGRRVFFDAEHFFDGFEDDAEYSLAALEAAKVGGAEVLVLCDTNGGSLPWRTSEVVEIVAARLKHPLGIHCHNDTGCAVANSLAAVRAGAIQVQGTINGYGERCGNANLCVIIPNLELKLQRRALPEGRLRELSDVARYVSELANQTLEDSMPYVGRSSFAHKGGVHVSAIRRNVSSYQHVEPELVGNECRVLVSELSGRANILSKAEELDIEVTDGVEIATLNAIKEAEARGVSYEGAEASVALLILRRSPTYRPSFRLLDFHVMSGERQGSGSFSEAMVKIEVGDETVLTAGEGNGPVSALDSAIRKALTPRYPHIAQLHLADYKVRILDGIRGAESTTRVWIDHRDGQRSWSTVGASPNIIEASVEALVDAFEYALLPGR